jgi:ketosteroid isomerase-like protein
MTDTTLDRAALERLTLAFTQTFNDNDIDAMMSYFADDAVYDQHNGEPARGLEEIRAAFEPQFAGAFGRMQFLQEDIFIDAEERKSMISWLCTLETKRGPAGWRGLDLLHFDGSGKIICKQTYAKAKAPLLQQTEAAE